jgi:parvulin-like peptidyl-prolyl isomerase
MHVMIQHIQSTLKRSRLPACVLLHWSVLIVLVAVAVVALGPREARSAEPEIIARVNGEPVSRDDLQRLLADPLTNWRLQQEQEGRTPATEELERLALKELIHRQLILQEARRRNFTVTDEELDQALSTLRRRFADIESFGAWMHERNLDDKSLFEAIRNGMLRNRVTAELVKDVRVTEEEVQQYYEAHKEDLLVGEEVRLGIIAVRDEATAKEILTALHNGESFSRLAKQRSIGQRAAQGGDTGWVDVRTLPPLLKETVGKLNAGDVGGPLQKAADEFLLVGMVGRRPLRATSLAAARQAIEQRLLASKQQEAIQAWLTEQEKNSKIEMFLQPR